MVFFVWCLQVELEDFTYTHKVFDKKSICNKKWSIEIDSRLNAEELQVVCYWCKGGHLMQECQARPYGHYSSQILGHIIYKEFIEVLSCHWFKEISLLESTNSSHIIVILYPSGRNGRTGVRVIVPH